MLFNKHFELAHEEIENETVDIYFWDDKDTFTVWTKGFIKDFPKSEESDVMEKLKVAGWETIYENIK